MTPTAKHICSILINCAQNRTTITYEELKDKVYPNNNQEIHALFFNENSPGHEDLKALYREIYSYNSYKINPTFLIRWRDTNNINDSFWRSIGRFCTSIDDPSLFIGSNNNKTLRSDLREEQKKKIQDDETEIIYQAVASKPIGIELSFQKPYKSIKQSDNIILPRFAILVGKNGSGKTHLLEAIKAGHIHVKNSSILVPLNINSSNISYFNFQTFRIKNQKEAQLLPMSNSIQDAWDLLDKRLKPDSFNMDTLRFSDKVHNFFSNNQDRSIRSQFRMVHNIIINLRKSPNEITYEEFINNAPFNLDDYEMLDNLSAIFLEYNKKLITWKMPKDDGGQGLSEDEMEKKRQESPWIILNEMFKKIDLPHKIIPPHLKPADIVHRAIINYTAHVQHDDAPLPFEDLSSGERILCALAITIFQNIHDSNFPDLLLLDEIDASLHPSMIKNLLAVIRDLSLEKNCKVILTTHSPTTVALAEESEIFEVQKGAVANKIKKISQSEAFNILSEGFMSLEKGIKLLDQVSRKKLSIFTEGNNTKHIEKAIDILCPSIKNDIELVSGLEDITGVNQLISLCRFFTRIDHDKPVLFVFDCDADGNTNKMNTNKMKTKKTYYHTFAKNEQNTITKKGIENLYADDLFSDCTTTKSYENKTKQCFDNDAKKDFLKKILTLTDKEKFTNFQPLIDKIKCILPPS